MAKSGFIVAYKTISIAAFIVVTLYLACPIVLNAVCTETNLCFVDENKVNSYSASCCCDEECSDCCYSEIPPLNKNFIFFMMSDRGFYRHNIGDLQKHISDNLIFAELYGIIDEERFTPQEIIYPIFKPPQV
jgi:hypothetical protein